MKPTPRKENSKIEDSLDKINCFSGQKCQNLNINGTHAERLMCLPSCTGNNKLFNLGKKKIRKFTFINPVINTRAK